MYVFNGKAYPNTLLNLFTNKTLSYDLKVVPEYEGDEEGREPTFQEVMQWRLNLLAEVIQAVLDLDDTLQLKVRNGALYLYMVDKECTLLPPNLKGYQITTFLWHEILGLKEFAPNIAQWKELGVRKIVYMANNKSFDNTECQFNF